MALQRQAVVEEEVENGEVEDAVGVAPATVSRSSANALLADGNVTLGSGAEMTQANVDALKQKILSHEFGIA